MRLFASQSGINLPCLQLTVKDLADPPAMLKGLFVFACAGDDSVACTLATDMVEDESSSSSSDDDNEIFDANQLRAIVNAMDEKDGDAEEAAAAARYECNLCCLGNPLQTSLSAEELFSHYVLMSAGMLRPKCSQCSGSK